MRSSILSEVFAGLCESRTHFDSMLARLEPTRKSKVADLLGAFLRRPLTFAAHFKIQLEASPEDFWALNFIRLKKHPGIHATLREIWEHSAELPAEGGEVDFPPAWIAEWERDWGAETARGMARLLSQDPLTVIRFHRKAFDQEGKLLPELEEWLRSPGLPKSRTGNYSARARIFRGFAHVQKNDWFKKGYFEIQDEGSQLMSLYALMPDAVRPLLGESPRIGRPGGAAVPARGLAPPLEVIDACAGAGGKTLALADLMGGKGRVFAYDVFDRKLRDLRQRTDRAEERNVHSRLLPRGEDPGLESFHGSADVVLIDAPCSGLGVLRRNPDTKWNRKPLEQAKQSGEKTLAELQAGVLRTYAPLVKPGGRLVYGVCTQTRSESMEIVRSFISEQGRFNLDSEGFVGPFDTDGFYMASLRAGS